MHWQELLAQIPEDRIQEIRHVSSFKDGNEYAEYLKQKIKEYEKDK